MTTDPSDQIQIVMPRREPRGRRSGRFILFAGVAGACVLGVGAGLWARPAMNERPGSAAVPQAEGPAPPAARTLQIVVDDRPPPVAAPIQVLPKAGTAPPLAVALPPPQAREPELLAPKRSVEGLMKVIAPALAFTAQKLTHPHFPGPPTLRADPPTPFAAPAIAAPKRVIAKAAPPKPRAPDARAIRLAHAQAQAHRQATLDAQAKAAAHKVELAKAAKAERLEQIRLAKAEARGHARALAEAREQARVEQLAQIEQAQIERATRAEHARKQQARLAALVRSLTHALPHKAKPEPPPILLARQDRKPGHHQPAHAQVARKAEPRIEQAALTIHKARPAPPKLTQASHPVRPRPEPAAPLPRASGLMRVSTHCASRDPGEAIVCADPNLGAAERQLSRAYQGARAAGVPEPELRQQQQRWLAARSTAAREAPWAVRDVYLARIAELNGQAREAHGDGY
jgi:hypothetical protein